MANARTLFKELPNKQVFEQFLDIHYTVAMQVGESVFEILKHKNRSIDRLKELLVGMLYIRRKKDEKTIFEPM